MKFKPQTPPHDYKPVSWGVTVTLYVFLAGVAALAAWELLWRTAR